MTRIIIIITVVQKRHSFPLQTTLSQRLMYRAVFVRFSLGGQSFDWRLATIAGMEVAKLVPWNSLLK